MSVSRYDIVAILLTSLLIVGLVLYKYDLLNLNRKDISFYYNLLLSKEKVQPGTKITDQDLADLNSCKKQATLYSYNQTRQCISDFYQKYTLKNGVNQAFSHLSLLQKKYPEFIQDCHYIAHGIGHAQLKLDNGNVGDALAAITADSFFKDQSGNCGSGYFHGVVEEYAKNQTTKEDLVNLLKPICKDFNFANIPVGNCYHGIGHAAYIQLNYNTQDALWVCNNVTTNQNFQYYCSSGLFMEASQDLPLETKIQVSGGKFDLIFCNSLEDKYKPACYNQMSAHIEKFSKYPGDHGNNIKYCKQITDPLLRLSCVEVIAASAVSQFHYTDVHKICIENTSTRAERILCTGLFASKIAKDLDMTRKLPIFKQTAGDICGYLSYFEAKTCTNLVETNSNYLYLLNSKSLNI